MAWVESTKHFWKWWEMWLKTGLLVESQLKKQLELHAAWWLSLLCLNKRMKEKVQGLGSTRYQREWVYCEESKGIMKTDSQSSYAVGSRILAAGQQIGINFCVESDQPKRKDPKTLTNNQKLSTHLINHKFQLVFNVSTLNMYYHPRYTRHMRKIPSMQHRYQNKQLRHKQLEWKKGQAGKRNLLKSYH